eukprot:TRINITY_DN4041_c0_g1_i2.p2 TRINITY_DN4041_c0_g1~~TRINITY_DN4041_c0_g1_i2.p2  ORF type:complete len:131 (+),score=7.72 TRINITY_DN4041_c0_g1_i2:39-431(+)
MDFSELPRDVVGIVLAHIPGKSAPSILRVSKDWHELGDEEYAWMLRCEADYNITQLWHPTWKRTYQELHTWRDVCGEVYGEYWGSNRCPNSFKFTATNTGFDVKVLYDPAYVQNVLLLGSTILTLAFLLA